LVIVVEVPAVREIIPRWGLIAFSAGTALLSGFICLGLVFQDLGDVSMVGFRGDEDSWYLQRSQWLLSASYLLAFVLLDASSLSVGRGGPLS